eukprot:5687579-Amphidinium_carterae.4
MLYASDATLTTGAVVACPLTVQEAVWLWVQTDVRAVLYQGDKSADMFLLLARPDVEACMAMKEFGGPALASERMLTSIRLE